MQSWNVDFVMCEYRIVFLFFFFSSRRRHTRFDCDWSSDVCSSDLAHRLGENILPLPRAPVEARDLPAVHDVGVQRIGSDIAVLLRADGTPLPERRSEERRVGKECRSRWSPYH